jgi:hypothetical protein
MDDTELREQFHNIIVRMERFEARMDGFDKRLADLQTELHVGLADVRSEFRAGLADVRGEFRPHLEGLDNRLNGLGTRLDGKAGTWLVGGGFALLGILMTVFKFFA